MKIFYAVIAAVLMTTSVAAMAEDGGDQVMKRMNEQRAIAMQHYQNENSRSTAVVSAPTDQKKDTREQQNEPAPVNDQRS
jgi:archaellum component FlaG (FlaF/FlaG flagellin family)